jgi:acyl-homoserine-lactone acylase
MKVNSMKVNSMKRTFLLCSFGALLAGCTPGTMATRTAPESSAEILWDSYGVPHIFASDRAALAHAWGWAQMQNHGELLLRLFLQGRGRAAELLGEAYLPEDRWVWTVGIPQRAGTWLAAQSPEMRAHISAFVAGINAFAAAHPEMVSDSLRPMLPVTETDVMTHGQRWMLSAFVTSAAQVAGQSRRWQERGSNAWAVAPQRTAAGHALLLANPHLPWADMFTWFEGQQVLPGTNLYGAALVGSPVLQIAFNDRLGWTHTVNYQDGEDLYELVLRDSGYEWEGGTRQFDVERQVLQVRQADGTTRPDTLTIRRSVHGPVVSVKDGKALALRTVGADLMNALDQWWRMGTARNFAEFEAAIRPNMLSSQNIIYADADGRIMYFFGGNTPVRPGGDFAYWAGIVPGTTSENLWTRLHVFDDYPRVVDPPSGWVQNANDPPWWATFPPVIDPRQYPAYFAPLEMSLRAQSSAALVEGNPRMTFEDMIRRKHSTEMELANRVLADLVSAGHASGADMRRQAAGVLERWDRRADAGSTGAVLFTEWWREYTGRVGRTRFAQPWRVDAPRTTPAGLADTAAAAAALEVAAQRVLERYGRLDVRWGEVYRLVRDTLNLPSNGAAQEFGVFRFVDHRPVQNNRFVGVTGDSYVAVVEFAPTPRAMSLITYGNASRAASPHRTDQLPLFAQQQLKPVWRARVEIEQNLVRRETIALTPPVGAGSVSR